MTPSNRQLRIGIDAHVVGRPTTGNERVMANLIPALREVSGYELFLYFGNAGAAAEWRTRNLDSTAVRCSRIDHPLARLCWTLPIASKRDDLDVLVCHYNRPLLTACRLVTIVHDVSFARFPEYFTRFERTYMRRTIGASMRRSAQVVTDSEFSKGEIVELFGLPPERITVSGHGVAGAFAAPGAGGTASDEEGQGPHFLCVGSVQPRKNLVTLVRAYARLLEEHPEVDERLVITGKEIRGDDVYRAGEELAAAGRIVFTGHVPDDVLGALMRNATAFAYPSLYEGFGLPPIEAMASGTAVVVSDTPVMREVTGDAAMHVAACDVGAWSEALWRLASDDSLRASLESLGAERARLFTWEASARRLMTAVEKAAAA